MNRRQFIARVGVGMGSAGLALSSPWWLKVLTRSERTATLAGGRLDAILAAAPVAKYWVSAADSVGRCTECHTQGTIEELGLHSPYRHRENSVKCLLCAQNCLIPPGGRGRCQARYNANGTLRSLVYGRPITIHVDPIEKKPFYHFLPGSAAYSLATSGCPLRCKFCQNWEISQSRPEDYAVEFTPAGAVADSAALQQAPVIAYTYNEPTVFTEYILDIAHAGKKQGLRSVMVSCGFMNETPLRELCGVLDAVKIDLKGFSEDFYRRVCEASLAPVLQSIKTAVRGGVHVEIVNLVVPTLNDSDEMLTGLANWVVGEVGPDIPVHFTRFHPDYQLQNLPPTPVQTLERARAIALDRGIKYAYVGNVPGHPGNHTYCPRCQRVVIARSGFFVTSFNLKDGRCAFCGESIAGVWA